MPTYAEDVLFTVVGKNVGSASAAPNVTANTLTVNSTSTFTGAQTFTGNGAFAGNVTVGGTLGVTGASTLSGNTTCQGTLAVTGAQTLTGNTTCAGTLAVTGAQTFTGNTTCSGNLAVTGTTTTTGLVTANGGVSGALNGTVGATTPNTGAFTTLTAAAVTGQTVKLAGLLSGNVTPVTANANSTSAQDLMTYALTAASLNSAGRTLHIWAAGNYTTQAAQTPTMTFTLLLGGITLATWTTAATTASQTTLPWNISAWVTCVSTGATGTLETHGNANYRLGSGAGTLTSLADANTAVSSAIDLTSAQTLKVQGTFSTNAATANIFVHRQLIINWLNV